MCWLGLQSSGQPVCTNSLLKRFSMIFGLICKAGPSRIGLSSQSGPLLITLSVGHESRDVMESILESARVKFLYAYSMIQVCTICHLRLLALPVP